ncbi:hypothetical protein [Actinoplanes sp. L3-i22]|uniref:hypothetical protein n=1 Tax=Actinoplanes sp. L3-i22 TaxID=2836373 RepID=UPI001C84D943|nr:hypothetical protein [Actinoplanes sp. L3-i22]
MDTERDSRTFERTVLKYAAGLCLVLLLLVARPAYEDIAARSDFAAGRLTMHNATVLTTAVDSGWDTNSHWVTQKISLRLDNGAVLTTPPSGTVVDVDEGATVPVGFSGSRLVSVNGAYVRSNSVLVVFGLLIMSGALVLSGIYTVLIRRSSSARRDPYTAGYVTQALVLYLLFLLLGGLVPDGRYAGWRPVMGLLLATAIPLIAFWIRSRRPAPAPIAQPDKT